MYIQSRNLLSILPRPTLAYDEHVGPESGDTVIKGGNADRMIEAMIEDGVKKFGPRPQSAHDTVISGEIDFG